MSLAKHLGVFQQELIEFVSLLEEEQRALTSSKVEGKVIADLASRKSAKLVSIDKLDEVRRKVQAMQNYPDGREGAKQAAKDGGCSDLWDAIMILTDRAKNLNELNGIQVHMHIEQNRRLMAFVSKTNAPSLYGRNGKPQRKSLGAISTKA